MSYKIVAKNEDGEQIAEFRTTVARRAAHERCAALGVEQDEDDTSGSGETFFYTRAEISAAQAALVLSYFDTNLMLGISFLRDIEAWLNEHPGETGVEITFA